MRTFFALLMLVLIAASAVQAGENGFTDIRSYIDSSQRYAVADTLTAAATYSDSVWVVGAEWLACDFYVVSITTNVVVRLLCSNTGEATDWMNADNDGNDLTITTDGQYSFTFTNTPVYRYYKLYWVSESGTSAKVFIGWRVGGKI